MENEGKTFFFKKDIMFIRLKINNSDSKSYFSLQKCHCGIVIFFSAENNKSRGKVEKEQKSRFKR